MGVLDKLLAGATGPIVEYFRDRQKIKAEARAQERAINAAHLRAIRYREEIEALVRRRRAAPPKPS